MNTPIKPAFFVIQLLVTNKCAPVLGRICFILSESLHLTPQHVLQARSQDMPCATRVRRCREMLNCERLFFRLSEIKKIMSDLIQNTRQEFQNMSDIFSTASKPAPAKAFARLLNADKNSRRKKHFRQSATPWRTLCFPELRNSITPWAAACRLSCGTCRARTRRSFPTQSRLPPLFARTALER